MKKKQSEKLTNFFRKNGNNSENLNSNSKYFL